MHFAGRDRRVHLGMASQDLLGELGAPDAQFSPRHDKLLIHYGNTSLLDANASAATAAAAASAHDYFFNFYRLGLDAQIDGDTHVVKRIILHTNAICHLDFSLYRKANIELVAADSSSGSSDSSSGGSASLLDQDIQPTLTGDMKVRLACDFPTSHMPLRVFSCFFGSGRASRRCLASRSATRSCRAATAACTRSGRRSFTGTTASYSRSSRASISPR